MCSPSTGLNMGDAEQDYLTTYRRFFEHFFSCFEPDNQLPVPIPNYRLTEFEAPGGIVHWCLHYLTERNCPPNLIGHLCHTTLEKIRETCRKNPEANFFKSKEGGYNPLPFMNATIKELVEVCHRYEDNAKLSELLPPPKSTLALPPFSSYSCKNSRRNMEDRSIAIPDLHAMFNIKGYGPAGYFAVFDGHNGVDAADYSCIHLHQYLVESPFYPKEPEKALQDAFRLTEKNFTVKAGEEKLKGGTTAVVALVRPQECMLYIAWVGDSLSALAARGSVFELVQPHTPLEEKERIESMGGYVIHWGKWRVNGMLAISRAIGDIDYKPYVSAEPDVRTIPLTGQEDFLVIACDGLWDVVDAKEASDFVYKHLEETGSVEGVSRKLAQLAKEKRSLDNISILVVYLKEEEAMESTPLETSPQRLVWPANFDFGDGTPKKGASDHAPSSDHLHHPAIIRTDEEDFGPETDVDSVEDVLAPPSIGNGKENPIPNVLKGEDNEELECEVEDSGEDSEEEWNYISGKDEKQPQSEELNDSDDMESRLNPDAAEFVPTKYLLEPVVSSSPCKGSEKSLDDLVLPEGKAFYSEITQRPSELDSSAFDNFLEKTNGIDGDALSTKAEFGDENSVFNLSTSMNSSLPFEIDNLASPKKETNPFKETTEVHNNSFDLQTLNLGFDPMQQSITELMKDVDSNEVDDQAPSPIPTQDIDSPCDFISSNDKTDLISPEEPGMNNTNVMSANQEPTSSSGFDSESCNDESDLNVQEKMVFGEDLDVKPPQAFDREDTNPFHSNDVIAPSRDFQDDKLEEIEKEVIIEKIEESLTKESIVSSLEKEELELVPVESVPVESVQADDVPVETAPVTHEVPVSFEAPITYETPVSYDAPVEYETSHDYVSLSQTNDLAHADEIGGQTVLDTEPVVPETSETETLDTPVPDERPVTPVQSEDSVEKLLDLGMSPYVTLRAPVEEPTPFAGLQSPANNELEEPCATKVEEVPEDQAEALASPLDAPVNEVMAEEKENKLFEFESINGQETEKVDAEKEVPEVEEMAFETRQVIDLVQELHFNESVPEPPKKVEEPVIETKVDDTNDLDNDYEFEIIDKQEVMESIKEESEVPQMTQSEKEMKAIDEKLLMDVNESEASPVSETEKMIVEDVPPVEEEALEAEPKLEEVLPKEVETPIVEEEMKAVVSLPSDEAKVVALVEEALMKEEVTPVAATLTPETEIKGEIEDEVNKPEDIGVTATPPPTPAPGVEEQSQNKEEGLIAAVAAAAGMATVAAAGAAAIVDSKKEKPKVEEKTSPKKTTAPPKKAEPAKTPSKTAAAKTPVKSTTPLSTAKKPSTPAKPSTTPSKITSTTPKPPSRPTSAVKPTTPTTKPTTPTTKAPAISKAPAKPTDPAKPATKAAPAAKPKPTATSTAKPSAPTTARPSSATKTTAPAKPAAPKSAAPTKAATSTTKPGDKLAAKKTETVAPKKPEPIRKPLAAPPKPPAPIAKAAPTSTTKPAAPKAPAAAKPPTLAAKAPASKVTTTTASKPAARPTSATSKVAPSKTATSTTAAKPKPSAPLASKTALAKPKANGPVPIKKPATADKTVKDATNNKLSASTKVQPKKTETSAKGEKKEASEGATQEAVITTTNGHIEDVIENGIECTEEGLVSKTPEIIEALN